ncbi:hypothetical protein DVK44_36180 [Streptomyces paludis]|uniref:Uncharacterized protein n=1 Tax=Streptomyces paludis TaxID=2282738 RepID=A0A345HZW0_9ACTN|nr:hypothetical protein DVK44_36180 [Streptomyces paludis]
MERARVGWPPALRELSDLLYEVYVEADTPSLDTIVETIAMNVDNNMPGSPQRDTVRRCIINPALLSQADVVSVAMALAQQARWDKQDLAARVRDLWTAARMATGVGRPLAEFDERLAVTDLGVHHALDTATARDRLAVLPPHVPRECDTRLDTVIAAAEAGQSGIAVLVGTSSTGKTRALWEATRKLPDGWRLWHPLAPTRPDAVLAGLADVAPRTVVWLNETQHYLETDPLGEQVAAGLRELLRDPARGPVLVLATLWPEHWDTLTTRTTPDRHIQAQELLYGHRINVPDAFTPAELAVLKGTDGGDPRLVEAAERAQDAQVTQYLAGVPVLMDRYRSARGITLALIHAAMDARRLGAGPHIPLAWLHAAAPGYLNDTESNATSDDWLPEALGYVTQECRGIPGILNPVKTTTTRNQRPAPTTTGPAAGRPVQGPQYQLADYLDQYGRHDRADTIPPIDFWTSAATHAHPTDQAALGDAAHNRGLYRDAAQLHKNATTHGNPQAAAALVNHLHALHPTDHRPTQWAATHTPLDDPHAAAMLLDSLRKSEADKQATILVTRLPATGNFTAFIEIDDHRERFRFGREPEGDAAAPWTWEDLA